MFWHLNYYLKPNDKTVYKFVKNENSYCNWTLIETYYFINGKIVTYSTYKKIISKSSKKRYMFKKWLGLFNRF